MKDLAQIIAQIDDPKLAKQFLEDILTPSEREEIDLRLKLMRMLMKGMSQREIAKKLGISLCKITRGSAVLKYGKGSIEKLLK